MSKQSHHTPGPWDYEPYGDHVSFSSPKHKDDYFMRVEFDKCVDQRIWDGVGDPPEDIANLRLIASAPELLESLEEMVSEYANIANSGDAGFWDPEKNEKVIKARAAIAKVKGTP